MHPKEVALFCFDAESGRPLTVNGEVPESPISEYCMAWRDRVYAKIVARGATRMHPHMMCALYDSQGKWLQTSSRKGVWQRNEGLGLALLLLQFPLLAVLGLAAIVAASELYAAVKHTHPPEWTSFSHTDWAGLAVIGVLLGAGVRFLVHGLHLAAIYLHGGPAREPFGSPRREAFYRQLVREKQPSLLVPREITFQPCVIAWPQPDKHDEWAAALRENGFQRCGQYVIPEVKVELEFWVNSADNVTSTIVCHPREGMWLSAYTRYEDRSSMTIAARFSPGLDPDTTKKVIYIGPGATTSEVLDRLKRERPSTGQLQPTAENILPQYQQAWTEFVDSRRRHGTSLEEYKRIDALRQIRKRVSSKT